MMIWMGGIFCCTSRSQQPPGGIHNAGQNIPIGQFAVAKAGQKDLN
jgi:hypothetical protein